MIKIQRVSELKQSQGQFADNPKRKNFTVRFVNAEESTDLTSNGMSNALVVARNHQSDADGNFPVATRERFLNELKNGTQFDGVIRKVAIKPYLVKIEGTERLVNSASIISRPEIKGHDDAQIADIERNVENRIRKGTARRPETAAKTSVETPVDVIGG